MVTAAEPPVGVAAVMEDKPETGGLSGTVEQKVAEQEVKADINRLTLEMTVQGKDYK